MPSVAIGIAFHSRSQPLVNAVKSALEQGVAGHNVYVVVLDSSKSGCAYRLLHRFREEPRMVILKGRARSAYAARNKLLRYAEARWKDLTWHVRLDADDSFVSKVALSSALHSAKPKHRVILAGNRQIAPNGRLVGRNLPTPQMLDRRQLLARIARMADGDFKAELPSCNLILKAGFKWKYPARKSAEDHWLVAHILLSSRPEWVGIRRLELVNYRLGGALTSANKKSAHYSLQRLALLEAAVGWGTYDR